MHGNEPRETDGGQQKQGKQKDKEFEKGKIFGDSQFYRYQAFTQKQEEIGAAHRERCYRTSVFKAVGSPWKGDHSSVLCSLSSTFFYVS